MHDLTRPDPHADNKTPIPADIQSPSSSEKTADRRRRRAHRGADPFIPVDIPMPPTRRRPNYAVCVLLCGGLICVGIWLWPKLVSALGTPSDGPSGESAAGDAASVEDATVSETESGARETDDKTEDSVGSDETDESEYSESESFHETEPLLGSPSETTDPSVGAESESSVDTETGTEDERAPCPDGCFSIAEQDLSNRIGGASYLEITADRLPTSLPEEGARFFQTEGIPSVLIVHSHPYEGYHNGDAWYDPATGPLAQTTSQNASDGVVALGASLTRALRAAGVTVIHLRVPAGEGESAGVIYERTEEAVRQYCDLYPDIGLVLDLRRSAELTETGEILKTAGRYEGQACAQIRLSVSADRDSSAVGRDLAAALFLRRTLWAEEPSLSRPVWVKSGGGLAADTADVCVLTVEVGASGNTFSEAARVLTPLGEAILSLLTK